ncbi:protein chibby homolog 1 [Callorhinchus milii]|uniref:protein chibby homolog 1 n=1 Tax=Callorhinchus milii TaxID=7868 RepID=UPI0004574015|nr:protein chibby homolog 1 [Callorhinchus milii]|eukprot:gi/632979251/ref/XP_007906367.1/ PREDICTED: uncharacterized protein LOC103188251 [Callorhinchus milii]
MDQFESYTADIRERIKFFIESHPLPCTNKFKPRKSVPRKNPPISSLYYLDYNHRLAELGLEHEPTELRFNGQRFTFRKGRWVSHSRDMDNSSQSDLVKNMRERNRLLQEQNNILTLKMETLMDMLTETTANLLLLEGGNESTKVGESQSSTRRKGVETEEEDVTCEYEVVESTDDQTEGGSRMGVKLPLSDDVYEYDEDSTPSDEESEAERPMTKCEIFRKNFLEKSKGEKAGQAAIKTHEKERAGQKDSKAGKELPPNNVRKPKAKKAGKSPGLRPSPRTMSYDKLANSGSEKATKRDPKPNLKRSERMYEIKVPPKSGIVLPQTSKVKIKSRK